MACLLNSSQSAEDEISMLGNVRVRLRSGHSSRLLNLFGHSRGAPLSSVQAKATAFGVHIKFAVEISTIYHGSRNI